MKFLPYEKFEITTPLPPEEVTKRLRENTEPVSILGFLKARKPFQGKIDERSFSIYHEPEWMGNAFNHTITGAINNHYGGSKITMRIMPPYFFLIPEILIMGMLLFIHAILLLSLALPPFDLLRLEMAGFSLLMFIFAWIIIVGSFFFEAGASKNTITNIIEGIGA